MIGTRAPAAASAPRAIHSLSPTLTRPDPFSIACVTSAVWPTIRPPRLFSSGSLDTIGRSRSQRRAEKTKISDSETQAMICSASGGTETKASTATASAAIAIQIR